MVVLKEISAVNLDSLLQFLYLGRVSVEQTRLESFLQAAEALRIRGLVNEGQNVRKRSTPGSSLGQEAKRRRQPPEEPKSSAAPFLNSRSQPEEPSTSRPEEDRGRSLEEPEEIILKCEPEDVVVFDHQQGQEGDGAGSHEEQITDGATSAAAGAPIAGATAAGARSRMMAMVTRLLSFFLSLSLFQSPNLHSSQKQPRPRRLPIPRSSSTPRRAGVTSAARSAATATPSGCTWRPCTSRPGTHSARTARTSSTSAPSTGAEGGVGSVGRCTVVSMYN